MLSVLTSSKWLQEIEATQSLIQRADQDLRSSREQADEVALQLRETVHLVEEAVRDLDLTLAGNNEGSSLLCLNSIEDFKEVDKALLAEMSSYWTAQVSSAPSCAQLIEV